MIASDYYYGGMYATRAGHLHPALYYKGLLEAAHRAGAILCANVEAERIEKTATGWRVLTSKGPIECREVVVATNGYTGDLTPRLKRRVVPVASHIIATEELPEHAEQADPGDARRRRHQAGADLLPALARRQAADLRRPRALHRGAAGSERAGALPVHDRPLPAARRHPHHPCVDGQRRLRARLHAAHGHRPGPALPAGLQRQWRRHDDLSRHPDRQEDRRRQQRADQSAGRPRLPRARPLQRRAVVPAHDRRLVPHARLDRPPTGGADVGPARHPGGRRARRRAHRRRGGAHALPAQRDAVAHRQGRHLGQVREPAVHRLVQGARRAQHAAAAHARGTQARRHRHVGRQPRPGRGLSRRPARHSRHHRHAVLHAQHEGRAHARPWRARRPARRHPGRGRRRGASPGRRREAGVRASLRRSAHHRGPGHDRARNAAGRAGARHPGGPGGRRRHDRGLRRRRARAEARHQGDRRRDRRATRPCTSCWPASR